MKNTCDGFVYKWTNNINGKWYIGSHQGDIDDGYTASGKLIKRAFEKYGIESFNRQILYTGIEFREKEEYYLNTYDAANIVESYNLKNTAAGGSVRGRIKTEKERKNISKSKLGKNNPMYGRTPWNKGIPRTKEQKYNHSMIMKGRTPSNKGISQNLTKCPHCQKHGGESVMKRWHFDNCGRLDRLPWNKGKIGVQQSPNKGKTNLPKQTAESNAKRSASLLGILDKIVICPYCSKSGGNSAMKRWHFDNCKITR